MTIADRSTTGIGSLPHHNVDAALAYSFRMGVPFLPQIPIRNPWEYMVAQALEGLPGLQADRDGMVTLNPDIWLSRSRELNQKLAEAFSKSPSDKEAFSDFEPSPAISSCWQPFLWELNENRVHLAKIQIAGPMTAQWALRLKGGGSIEKYPDLSTQIFRLVLARALAMARRVQAEGAQPVLYLDEPGLYGFSASNPKHMLGLQELRLLIQTLRKEGILVGLHCCSNTDWNAVLSLDLNYLSLDTDLSLRNLIATAGDSLTDFVRAGGRLSLGVIPTARSPVLQSLDVQSLFAQLLDSFSEHWSGKPELVRKVMSEAIYTPACGLALHTVADAELILEALNEFYDFCATTVIGRTVGSA